MRRYSIQVLSAFILNCGCLSFGIVTAWPASTYLLFKSEETPLHRPMGDWELSLLGSISSISCLIGYPLTGLLLDRLGRKKCAIMTGCIRTMAWGLIAFSNCVEVILAALFLAGISSSIFMVVPICNESIRGTLTSSALVFYRLGILISYITGDVLSYSAMVYVCLTISVIALVLLTFLKQSPTLLMKKGMEEEARKSIVFYTNLKPDSEEVLQEIMKINKTLDPEKRETQNPEEEKLTSAILKRQEENIMFFQFIRNSKSTQRGFILSMSFMTMTVFQGMSVVLVYSNPLFSEAIPEETLSVAWCSIILAIVCLVFGSIAAYLTDRAGRRPLMIISSVAASLWLVALGTQIQLHWGPHWLTALFVYLYSASYQCGAGTVPYVFTSEAFLPEVKSILVMLVIEWVWLCNFIILFIFNPLVAAIGLGPVFYIFAAICFCSAIISVFFFPETNGLTVDAIQLLFVKQKRNNVV